ncbi:MAG TPA: preprotein translocase subunit SecA, partial [Microbacteriaceae bacterium]|nr:preprotein translocase subunit SecA [Microbacteriaceae bacterium]
ERHESRRIDNQLRGRSGRQGDPGESRFYLSLTDDLMRLFNSGAAASLMNRSSVPDDMAIESKFVSRAIQSAQSQVEARNAEIRKNVLKYDDVLNRQRKAIYADREQILDGENIESRIDQFRDDVVNAIIDTHQTDGSQWDFDALWKDLGQIYKPGISIEEVLAEGGGQGGIDREFLKEEIISDLKLAYAAREEKLGTEAMRELERRVVLTTIDRRWRDHLYEMEYLKEGIGLRAMAQRDPLVEYQREGFNLFQNMMGQIKEESLGLMHNLEVQVMQPQDAEAPITISGSGLEVKQAPDAAKLSYSAPAEDGGTQVRGPAAGRRAPSNRQQQAAAARQQTPASRGAFGQAVQGEQASSGNRADRRSKKK